MLKTKHFGFTGTQGRLHPDQTAKLTKLLDWLMDNSYRWMHNGMCIGADALAAELWRGEAGKIHGHPPTDTSKMARFKPDVIEPPKPYLVRNHDIVDASRVLVATPGEMQEEQRSGTWSTVRYARKVGRRIYIVWPDGSVTNEKPVKSFLDT